MTPPPHNAAICTRIVWVQEAGQGMSPRLSEPGTWLTSLGQYLQPPSMKTKLTVPCMSTAHCCLERKTVCESTLQTAKYK